MSAATISERQQYWLEHLRAAEASDDTIAGYARSNDLKPKDLYMWKGILARRGFLDGVASPASKPDGTSQVQCRYKNSLQANVIRPIVNLLASSG